MILKSSTSIALPKVVAYLLVFILSRLGAQAQTFSNFTPTTGATGTQVSLQNANFTGVTAVTFNGVNAPFFSPSAGSVLTQVPAGATTGFITVTAGATTYTSDAVFTVTLPTPRITTFSPQQGQVGTVVNIQGQNFTGVTQVFFNNVLATNFTVNSNISIVASVPTGASTGIIKLVSPLGADSTTTVFNIVAVPLPEIISFSPSSGPAGGTLVSIQGNNFLTPSQVINITFNGTPITQGSIISNNELEVEVPLGATTGPIEVFSSNGSGVSATNFIVTGQNLGFCYTGPNRVDTFAVATLAWQNSRITQNTAKIYKFFPTRVGDIYSFSACGSPSDVQITVYQGGVALAASGGNGPDCPANPSNGSLNYQSQSRDTIYVQVASALCRELSREGRFRYRILAPPVFTSMTPQSGPELTRVTLRGRNLTLVEGLFFSNVFITPLAQTDTTILWEVPAFSVTSPVGYQLLGSVALTAYTFTVCNNTNARITTSTGSNIVCSNGSLTLNGPAGQGWLWSTGESTRRITVTTGGTYWVDVTNNGCVQRSANFNAVSRAFTPVSLTLRNDSLLALPRAASYTWFRDNLSFNNPLGSVFIPTQSGLYRVIGSINGCRDTAALLVTNLENTLAPASWNLYPNPASQVVNIDSEQPLTLGIYAMTGTLVQQAELTPGANAVPINMLAPGIYYLTDGRVRKRLVVQ